MTNSVALSNYKLKVDALIEEGTEWAVALTFVAGLPNIDLNLPKLLALLNCPQKFAPKFCHRPPPFYL